MKNCLHYPEKLDKRTMQWTCQCGALKVSHIVLMETLGDKDKEWEKEESESQS